MEARSGRIGVAARIPSPMRRAVYEVVSRIPRGKVATYGQIAALAGYPGRARQVGYALAGMPEEWDLPWHRVINAQGRISPRKHSKWHEFQYQLLVQEGVVFENGRVDLERYRWQPGEEERRGRDP